MQHDDTILINNFPYSGFERDDKISRFTVWNLLNGSKDHNIKWGLSIYPEALGAVDLKLIIKYSLQGQIFARYNSIDVCLVIGELGVKRIY